jgi:rsbT co-antagonist protein RsbR
MKQELQGYMELLGLDERELQSRLAADFRLLGSLKSFANTCTKDITEALYELLLQHPDSRTFFPDDATINHVKQMQNKYFLGLFSGVCDLDYVTDRLWVGVAHERIGMPPKLYIGAYRRYVDIITAHLYKEFKQDPAKAAKAASAIRKLIFFDMALAIDTYIAAYLETMTRHQAALRELSTPVIKVHDRILLLPIVGTVDTQGSQQIMETVLSRIIEEQAKVIILDIAGVPVVDTKVADHLVKTTAAVKLLGAQTILTGISAMVARTIVQLGVEITSMHTTTKLSDGIDLALDIVGKKVIFKKG